MGIVGVSSGPQPKNEQESTDYTSTNSWVTVADLDLRPCESASVTVIKTGASNTIEVDAYTRKIYGNSNTEAQVNGFSADIATQNDYGAIEVEKPIQRLTVKVRSKTSGQHSDYTVVTNRKF